MCRIERLSQLGEPSRTVCGGNRSWYTAHPVPLSHEIMTYAKLTTVPCFRIRSGAEIV